MPSRIKLRPRSTPPTPGPDSETLFLDEADGVLKSIDSEGVVTAVEGEGGGAAEAGTVVAQNVGTNTTYYGHLFVGDADPADTETTAAGDTWIDTTGGVPYQQKQRNDANDGWDIAAMVLKNGLGEQIARVDITPDGTVSLNGGFDLDPALLVSVYINQDGSAGIINGGVPGSPQVSVGATGNLAMSNPNGAVSLFEDGSIQLAGFFTFELGADGKLSFAGPVVKLPNLPTADPATGDGALWLNSGVLTISS